ncbi:MAG: GNAT family N-acetyltransferase [Actinomycetota bacterium]
MGRGPSEQRCDEPGWIRPVEPADAEALVRMFDRLSPESVYRRFFTRLPKLEGKFLEWFAVADHDRHEGVVYTAGSEILGVAHYQRLDSDPFTAEIAVIVEDDCQRRGIAKKLMNRLTRLARERGISHLSAVILSNNKAAQSLATAMVPDVKPTWDGAELAYSIPVRPADPGSYPSPAA